MEVVQKILARFPEISPAWLMLGEGAMLKGLEPGSSKNLEVTSKPEPAKDSDEKPERKEKVQEIKSATSAPLIPNPSEEKQLVKVILFYSDGSFENFGNSL
ncbi:hypothetical protein TH63_06680 [Rufibacter radiotolerans]|uniref:Uncharacterized protein n=2 Tax=Rufibacter radiotolerans TaxID=1379910 RepID=A0A0H4VNS8_9BACT|nr:hypothetical protein TH63_06680 [Rufibacter radiotolerans]